MINVNKSLERWCEDEVGWVFRKWAQISALLYTAIVEAVEHFAGLFLRFHFRGWFEMASPLLLFVGVPTLQFAVLAKLQIFRSSLFDDQNRLFDGLVGARNSHSILYDCYWFELHKSVSVLSPDQSHLTKFFVDLVQILTESDGLWKDDMLNLFVK